MNRWLIGVVIIFISLVVLFVNPLDLYSKFRYQKEINNLLSDPVITDNLFGVDNLEAINTEYLGSKIFKITVADDSYLVSVDSIGSGTAMEIFKREEYIRMFE